MGSFDFYCAICAGPLGVSGVSLGSKNPLSLVRRRKRIKRRLEWKHDGSTDDEEPNQTEPESNEEYSYDPEIISIDDIAWTDSCRCIGFNADALGDNKAFITGRGQYDAYGSFTELEPGGDLNDPGLGYYDCYTSTESDDSAVFPFHELCYDLLARYISGEPDHNNPDKDIMYSTMAHLYSSEGEGFLSYVDYGLPNEMGQFWICNPGEEWTVCDFSTKDEMTELLREKAEEFTVAPSALNLSPKVRSDPLAKLPFDILYLIYPHLDKSSIINLVRASWHVFSSTQDDIFWKQLIRRMIVPWFWELIPVLDAGLPGYVNYKHLFFWLDKMTDGTYGMEGQLIAIANRKRIWSVCSQIAEVYQRKMSNKLSPAGEEHENEEAKAILEASSSSFVPIVALPVTKAAEAITSQFIRSWGEIEHEPCWFESSWNTHGALVGLRVTFGDSIRTFGEFPDGQNGYSCYLSRIPPNDWIREIVLGYSEVNIFGGRDTRAVIASVTLNLTSGEDQFPMKGPHSNIPVAHMRVLTVPPNRHLIGFIGRIDGVNRDQIISEMMLSGQRNKAAAEGAVISRLGILHASHPLVADVEKHASSPAQDLLWDSMSAYLPDRVPIWNHPRINMLPIWSHLTTDIPYDMTPHHAWLWAQEESQLRSLKRLSAYVIESNASVAQPVLDILAFRAEFHEPESTGGRSYETSIIGYPPKQRPDDGSPSGRNIFDEENWIQFDIDGPGGERVTNVHVAEHGKAVMLKTNRGRTCNWGEEYPGRFKQLRAPEGEVIVGLVAAFGKPSGYNYRTETYNHLKSTAITALTMALEEGEREK